MQDAYCAAAQKVQKLIREVRGMEVWAARSLALEELQQLRDLQLDPHLIDQSMRRVAEQRSTEELVESLKAFAASLAPQKPPTIPPIGPSLSRIAVRKVGARDGYYFILSADEILYIFVGCALPRGLINASWAQQQALRPDRVYLRHKEVFLLPCRSLAKLQEHLDPGRFFPIHRSILVNMQKISEADFKSKVKQVGIVLANGSKEWLTVSRRCLKALRQQLGLSPRGREEDKTPCEKDRS